MNLENEYTLSFYKELSYIDENKGIKLVQHIQTGDLYAKKELPLYALNVYKQLLSEPVVGIPKVKEIIVEDNQVIIIEEYVKGKTLQRIFKEEGPLNEERAGLYFSLLVDTVAKLHKMIPPVIHRDIKPDNIIITDDGALKLIDFDAAKNESEEGNKDTHLLGTENFAAPEQYGFGKSDLRTDIYGIGSTMNYLMSGKYPNEGIVNNKYAEVLKKCLKLQPENRYQDAGELKLDLEAIRQGKKKVKKKKSKKKTVVIILIVLFILFFGLLLFSDDEEYDYDEDYYSDDYIDSAIDDFGDGGSKKIGDIVNTSAVRERQITSKGNGDDIVTMLIYMNGSDLESEDGEATNDLKEIIAAGESDKVNVVVMTMGTKKWSKDLGIASDRSQIYEIHSNGLKLVKDDLGQLDCTSPETLENFIIWGAKNYPADRYILHFWNHGGGPVYGFGYDEWQDEDASLTTDEIQTALYNAGVYFDCIGMDCCIMSCMEFACAMYDYADYLILSEDFESGLGWDYTGFMSALYDNSSIDTKAFAKIAIDDMVKANSSDYEWGDKAILSLIDESMMKVVYTAWRDFAYENEDSLLSENYSVKVERTGRAHPMLSRGIFDYFAGEENVNMSDYYVTDIMAVANSIDSESSEALASAISKAVVYSNATSEDSHLTGLSVTLPYGDKEFYSQLKPVMINSGLDKEYVLWLERFVNAEGDSYTHDYSDWDDYWDGWDDYEDDYDWSDWDYYYDDEYWDSDDYFGFDDFDYEESLNCWDGDCDEYYDYDDYLDDDYWWWWD